MDRTIEGAMQNGKDGLWGIVNGTETATTHAELHAKFVQRRDRALGYLWIRRFCIY